MGEIIEVNFARKDESGKNTVLDSFEDTDKIWSCDCESILFFVTMDSFICAECGQVQIMGEGDE